MRHVVVLAQEEARLLGDGHIGSDHLLLGLLHDNDCAQSLAGEGVSLPSARECLGNSQANPPTHGHIPFTRFAKSVLEDSLREMHLADQDRRTALADSPRS